MLRNVAPRDTGKAPFAQAPVSGLPFKEHHLKQLRAQCLVFLAFRYESLLLYRAFLSMVFFFCNLD